MECTYFHDKHTCGINSSVSAKNLSSLKTWKEQSIDAVYSSIETRIKKFVENLIIVLKKKY